MPRQITKQKLLKRQICSISRIIACISFLVLTIIGVSSMVRAMSLETINNENGIPSSWEVASLGNPATITVPITYWDQRQDPCGDENRQFEWTMCNITASSAQQGIVQNQLGKDGLPIPKYTSIHDARAAGIHPTSRAVIGQNPVQPGDNFYMWFHETDRSKQFDRTVTFNRTGNNTYSYGGSGIFPLDNVNFSDGDQAWRQGHNFHFTAHLKIAMKIAADGRERFDFSGDDDVWVFLNGKLVLDIGGLHSKLSGHFIINRDGTLSTYVDTAGSKTIDAGLHSGQVVNLDFFYAERSTTESNTNITISNMNWPISADSKLESEIVGQVENSEKKLVQNIASITNRDPNSSLNIERIAAYLKEDTTDHHLDGNTENITNEGYIPLDVKTLYYSPTPDVANSWQPVEISKPSNSTNGFTLATPLQLTPSGTTGDTLYFRYFTETSELSGNQTSQINFYTSLGGESGVAYDHDSVAFTGKSTLDTPAKEYELTIKYLDKEQNSLADEYHATLPENSEYNVKSPKIDGYTPDQTEVSGTITDSNVETIVTYTENKSEPVDPTPPEPVDPVDPVDPNPPKPDNPNPDNPNPDNPNPDQPDTPNLPETPDQPTEPNQPQPSQPSQPDNSRPSDNQPQPTAPSTRPTRFYPSSNIIGDASMLFLNPLGEVAYVPNTGIISDAVLPIFDEYFADLILSQGFVMMMLLIFSGSFALYFSLRKYLTMNLNTVTRKTTNKAQAYQKLQKTKATQKAIKKTLNSQKASRTKISRKNSSTTSAKSSTKRSKK